jgi:hypothetical protein
VVARSEPPPSRIRSRSGRRPATQCAAVITRSGATSAPPHTVVPRALNDTIHGVAAGSATTPREIAPDSAGGANAATERSSGASRRLSGP